MSNEPLTFNDLPQVVAELRDEVSGMKALLLNLQNRPTQQRENRHRPVTPEQVAEYTNIPLATIYQKLANREIPGSKPGKRWVIYLDEIDKWLEANRKNPIPLTDEEQNAAILASHKRKPNKSSWQTDPIVEPSKKVNVASATTSPSPKAIAETSMTSLTADAANDVVVSDESKNSNVWTAHITLLRLFYRTVAETVKETVDLAQAVSHMKVAFQIVHGLQLAAGIEQAADDHVAEHVARNPAIADSVIETAKNQLWANHLYLRVVQLTHKTLKTNLVLINPRKQGLMMTGDIVASLCHKALYLLWLLARPYGLYHLLLATPCLCHHLNTDRARLVGFLAYKHGAKIARDTQNPKFLRAFLLKIRHFSF